MLVRHVVPRLRAALADRPVVLIHGPRQCGKSTLAREIDPGRRYLTLDDSTLLAAAAGDPQSFILGLGGPVVIDEVQRVPDILRAIKLAVDRDRTPGRFLLTGSANPLLVPGVSESLAGRMELIELWPLSQGEIEGRRETFIDRACAGRFDDAAAAGEPRDRLWGRIVRGGLPEVVSTIARPRRGAWFESYLTSVLLRDVRDLATIEDSTILPRLLVLLAARTGGLLNIADLARTLSVPQTSLRRYLAMLEALHLARAMPAWSPNLSSRVAKAPKIHLMDSGLAAHLTGAAGLEDVGGLTRSGNLLESFAAAELGKQLGWSETEAVLHHFRTHAGREVDLVLESRDGRIVGVEMKASMTASVDDFRGLAALKELAGPKFVRGFVLYGGEHPVAFGPDLLALPVPGIWS